MIISQQDDIELVLPSTGFVQDAFVPIVCCILLGLLMLGGPIAAATGHLNLDETRSEGPNLSEPGIQIASALAGVFLLGMAARLCYQGLVYCRNPFVFDRRIGQLRLGDKPLCHLSEILQVELKEQRVEEYSAYRLELILANARRIGFGPFLRFSQEGAKTRKVQIEAFLKRPPRPTAKSTDLSRNLPSPTGVWDRELDR